jgi:hypothetical protein
MLKYEVIWGILYMGLKLDWSLSRGWKVKTLLAAPQPYRAEITNQITPEIPTWKFFVAKIFHHRPSSCKLSSDVGWQDSHLHVVPAGNLITIGYSIGAKKSHEPDDTQPKKLVNDLYRAMCDCYNDHRSHRAKGQDTASSPHGLYTSMPKFYR